MVYASWNEDAATSRCTSVIDVLRASGYRSQSVVVDNSGRTRTEIAGPSGSTIIPGTNSSWEFSAYDEGRAWLSERAAPALWLFLNDRFDAGSANALSLLSPASLRAVRDTRVLAGVVDRGPPDVTLFGAPVTRWVKSNFFMLSDRSLRRVAPIAEWTEPSFRRLLPLEAPPSWRSDRADASLAASELDASWTAWIAEWLTGQTGRLSIHWYGAKPPEELAWELFRGKVRGILNEHRLTQRAEASGLAVLPLRLAGRIGAHPGSRLSLRLAPKATGRILENPKVSKAAALLRRTGQPD